MGTTIASTAQELAAATDLRGSLRGKAQKPESNDDGTSHRRWARTASESLASRALLGYSNLLGPAELQQIDRAFGRMLDACPR